jgi:hypothetical protein
LSLLEHYGFSASLDHFAMFGLCSACADAYSRSGDPKKLK